MNDLNNAFIKAYSRDVETSEAPAPQEQPAQHQPVDSVYSGGTWYRIEQPTWTAAAEPNAVPMPHVQFMPNAQQTLVQQPVQDYRLQPAAQQPITEQPAPQTHVQPVTPVTEPLSTAIPATEHVVGDKILAEKIAQHITLLEQAAQQTLEVTPATVQPPQPAVAPENTQENEPATRTIITEPSVNELPVSTASFAEESVAEESAATPEPTYSEQITAQTAEQVGKTASEQPETAQTEQTSAEAAEENATTFQPVWEVDRFAWPKMCDLLLEDEVAQIQTAGDRLKTAVEDGLKVMGICSARRGEGRTTLALTLAKAAANAGLNVAVIDADFTNRALGQELGVEVPSSWEEVAFDGLELQEAGIVSLTDKLTIFPLTTGEERAISYNDKQVQTFIAEAGSHYDLLLLDMQPVTDADAMIVDNARNCPIDAAIVVQDLTTTSADQVTEVVRKLQLSGISAVGIAENHWKVKRKPPRQHKKVIMYHSHWQLESSPFENCSDSRFYYASPTHQGALLKLRYAIENHRGAAAIISAAGLGKTMLLGCLQRQLPEKFSPMIHLIFPQMSADQMLAYLVAELCNDPAMNFSTVDQSVRRLQERLNQLHEEGLHPVVMIDEAHLIDTAACWDMIRLLLNFEVNQLPGLTLILSGQSTLFPLLERMPDLNHRLSVKCQLEPLSLTGTIDYVQSRLQNAGAKTTIFTEQALEKLHQTAHGIPRQINRLADLALVVGFAEQRDSITPDEIDSVAQELLAAA